VSNYVSSGFHLFFRYSYEHGYSVHSASAEVKDIKNHLLAMVQDVENTREKMRDLGVIGANILKIIDKNFDEIKTTRERVDNLVETTDEMKEEFSNKELNALSHGRTATLYLSYLCFFVGAIFVIIII